MGEGGGYEGESQYNQQQMQSTFDYYFKVDKEKKTYSEMWLVMEFPGSSRQEIKIPVGFDF